MARVCRLMMAGIVFFLLVFDMSAMAKTAAGVINKNAKVYAKPSTTGKVIAKASKGSKVTVVGISGKWAKVSSDGKVGYIAKAAVSKVKADLKTVSTNQGQGQNEKKTKGASVKQVQQRLVSKGYLKKSAVTGRRNAAMRKAVRIFQMVNGLSVSGNLGSATVAKIMSSSARAKPKMSNAKWASSGIEAKLSRHGGLARIIDLKSGTRLNIRRVGGHNHLDVEPRTASDTAKLKKIYSGGWSWNSRAIILIAGGRYYAAAMNGMPHGSGSGTDNNFNGQFCIHLNASTTHGTEKQHPQHQRNVDKTYNFWSK